MGDVKALLRAIRLFYRKTAVLSTLRTTMQADYSSLRNYMAALETNFIRLTKLGYTLPDDHKRFYLLEGLSEDYIGFRVPRWLPVYILKGSANTDELG